VTPELSPARQLGFVLRRILDFGLLSSTWAGKPLGFVLSELGFPEPPHRDNAKRRLSLQAAPGIARRRVRPSERSEQHQNERSEPPTLAERSGPAL
jgi:hypothetical protein